MANPLPVAHDDTVIAEATQYAVTFHQRGQLAEAEKLYAAILKVRPDHFNALHLLGVLRQEQGDSADAARLLQAALNMNPRSVEALCNLGRVLNSLNLYDETLEVCDRPAVGAASPISLGSTCPSRPAFGVSSQM